MDITITPRKLAGSIQAIPSKSQAHRLLICSAFADKPTELICPHVNIDIETTAECLRKLGAEIIRTASGYYVQPVNCLNQCIEINCRESGSTLRFMLPILCALGVEATIKMEGRLPNRPLSPLWEELERHGAILKRISHDTIHCSGHLSNDTFTIDGSISSQFITGLLFAMILLPGKSELRITGKIESKPYIDMTLMALSTFGIHTSNFSVPEAHTLQSPGVLSVEGDWSNSAFFLAANKLGSHIEISGLNYESPQGDRVVADLLEKFSDFQNIDATDIPDLVPILSVCAGCLQGACFSGIHRLRLKESDRVLSTSQMIRALGGSADVSDDNLSIRSAKYHGCIIDSYGDHRIAMAAAIAATVADGPVTIKGAECVSKSYPHFWEDYRKLGGIYEQFIR